MGLNIPVIDLISSAPARRRRHSQVDDAATAFSAVMMRQEEQMAPWAPLALAPREIRPDRPIPAHPSRLDETHRRERRRSAK